jgi:lysine 6-dehydrogenase
MRVVALGAGGVMGRFGVRDLASKDSVEEILIADYDLKAAQAVASELGSKCSAKKVDANNHDEMVDTVRGYDVAMGTIGPFYKYEKKVARACIDAGVNYVSICDDYDAAAAFLELDDDARKAGVTAITGVGWTPGITNMLARMGADRFDEVESINVAWGCHTSDTEGKAVTFHAIHIFAGCVPSFQEGRTAWIDAGSQRELMRFPAPVGEVFVYHLGHPEPVTIPRYINARTVTLKGGLKENYFNILSILMSRLRLSTSLLGTELLSRFFNAILPVLEKLDRPSETASACRVDITGKVGGKWEHLAYGAVAHMDKLTCLPTSIVVQMVGEGLITDKGALPPEACVDPKEFLKRLAEGGVRIYEGDEMVKPLEV